MANNCVLTSVLCFLCPQPHSFSPIHPPQIWAISLDSPLACEGSANPERHVSASIHSLTQLFTICSWSICLGPDNIVVRGYSHKQNQRHLLSLTELLLPEKTEGRQKSSTFNTHHVRRLTGQWRKMKREWGQYQIGDSRNAAVKVASRAPLSSNSLRKPFVWHVRVQTVDERKMEQERIIHRLCETGGHGQCSSNRLASPIKVGLLEEVAYREKRTKERLSYWQRPCK